MSRLRTFLHIWRRISLWNTIRINFIAFPFKQALRFPIICGHRIYIKSLCRGGVIVHKPSVGAIRLGIEHGAMGIHHKEYSYLNVLQGGQLIFNTRCNIAEGFHINVQGEVTIGENASAGPGLIVSSEKRIAIGAGSMLGWNVTLIDSDGHPICQEGSLINPSSPISVGCNCWLASHVTILKGVSLPEETIVPAHSVVTKSIDKSRTIYGAGNKIIKENVNWSY